MIIFAWWTLSIAAALTAGACGGVIYTQHRIRVVAEEVRITAPIPEARAELTALQPADVLAYTREVLLDEEPTGRHDPRVAPGSSAQRARWHSDTHAFHIIVGGTWTPRERAELEMAT